MSKYNLKIVKYGNNFRVSYGDSNETFQIPNLIDIQKKSYDWFLNFGLKEILDDVFPIETKDGILKIECLDCKVCKNEFNDTIQECKYKGITYSCPVRVKIRLIIKEKGKKKIQKDSEIFLCNLPIMTDAGTFIINGVERVVINQLVRSPGLYYFESKDNFNKYGEKSITSTVIPNRGSWLEYEIDNNNVFYVYIDKSRKIPVTSFIRALGISSDEEIIDMFGNLPKIINTIKKDISKDTDTGLIEVFKRITTGLPLIAVNAKALIDQMFFNNKRYDLNYVGRYKINKKLDLKNRIVGCKLAEDVIDSNKEKIKSKNLILTEKDCEKIQNSGVPYVTIYARNKDQKLIKLKVLSNLQVDITKYVNATNEELDIYEKVYYPELIKILKSLKNEKSLSKIINKIKKNKDNLIVKHLTKEDIFASINYLLLFDFNISKKDDIDHLANRRVRAVGELLQNKCRMAFINIEQRVKEKIFSHSLDELTPKMLLNIKNLNTTIQDFFCLFQLSQFMDQNNPLSEITNKRRLSSLGPSGLSRERAGFEVRDIHYTHYGKLCPIETPEGQNIGLISSLALYAKVNKYGFIESPYRKIDKTNKNNPVVTDEIVYMSAEEEDNYHIAQASELLDAKGHFIKNRVSGRYRGEIQEFEKTEYDYMDVSPKMLFSPATAMIPFLQNDDASRALMGSNMQRQAVPLMITEANTVGTGIEDRVAKDSGVCVLAKNDGIVKSVDACNIVIKNHKNKLDEYKLVKFFRSNQSNCYNQKPIVSIGDKVKKGQVIADGAATKNGELALGKNPLIGFMMWEGYNYEDAVLISERLVSEDVYTSIHIEEYELVARNTKIGKEEMTNDIYGISEEAKKHLSEDGVVIVGTEVKSGDILVGKITPKEKEKQTPEEKLLQVIFGDKAKDVRDTSLRMPHGESGIVIDTKIYTRKNHPGMPLGINKMVKVYVAQKRKISVGDKMAGRHGNKGIVSRIIPVEDMPFLENGRPLDILLNPLGVPSRMNVGQILETHLSLVSKILGFNISTPIFSGIKESNIFDLIDLANDYANNKWSDFEKKYKKELPNEIFKYLSDHKDHKKLWEGVNISKDCKVKLRDGRTGEYFDGLVTIGHMNYLKLHHLVEDKMHSRSVGPYALITQQPLGGKAQFGGQRFGEMEVWALEAYGAANTLREILTIKSDDIEGRNNAYESIIQGKNIDISGIPESFKVLIQELRSLSLDVKALDDDEEVEIFGN